MTRITSVGIDLSERSLRYAVVRRSAGVDRLLRLGQVDFAFDVPEALAGEAYEAERGALARAIVVAVAETGPDILRVALHPPLCRSFFMRVQIDSDPADAARFEAELLGFCAAGDDSTVVADVAFADEDGRRMHVSVIAADVLDRMAWITYGLATADAQAVSGMRAAAEVYRRLSKGHRATRFVALGRFEHVIEVSVLDPAGWRFAGHTTLENLDNATPILDSMLLAAGEKTVTDVSFYGASDARGRLWPTTGMRREPYDPLDLLEHDPAGLHSGQSSDRFAAAIGASLL